MLFDLGVLEIIKNGKNQYNDSLTFTVDGSSKQLVEIHFMLQQV